MYHSKEKRPYMPLFSLIMPVYNNTKEELENSINSVLKQSYSDYELVIIDDGSCDSCAKLLDTFVQTNIHVYHCEHQGVSASRNYGVLVAKGMYISFLDADDLLTNNFLLDVANILNVANPDIIYGLLEYVNIEKSKTNYFSVNSYKNSHLNYCVLNDNDMDDLRFHMFNLGCLKYHNKGAYISRGPVAKILKKSLCLNCLFNTELQFGEDEEWNLRLLTLKPVAIVSYRVWYYYIYRNTSTLHRFRANYIDLSIERLKAMQKYILSSEDKKAFHLEAMRNIKEILQFYILSDSFNGSMMNRLAIYDTVLQLEPWKSVLTIKNFFNATIKGKVYALMIKSYILFFIMLLRK